jgi:uncharacterized membrane protein HdeD (DUF308 family)
MEKIKIVRSDKLSMARLESKNSIAIGVLLAILGMFAIMSPVFSGISTTFMVGALLFVTGVFETVFAFKQDSFGKGTLKFIFGGLSIAAGIALFAVPAEGMGVLTIILIAYFFAAGILGIIVAFQVKPAEGWEWIMFNAVITILFGILVIANWPVSGVWLLGFYVGLKILLIGFVFILTGRTGQEALRHLQDSRIEMLETYAVEGAQVMHELQVALLEQAALIAALGKELKGKVSSSDVDPAMKELNKDLGEAREFMKDVKSTTMEAWDKLQDESREDIEKLKKKADALTKDLKEALGLDKK